jgi:hypothetical protein
MTKQRFHPRSTTGLLFTLILVVTSSSNGPLGAAPTTRSTNAAPKAKTTARQARSKRRVTTKRPPVKSAANRTVAPTTNLSAPTSGVAGGSPSLAGCPIFPADNPWNQSVTNLPVHPMSGTWVASVNSSRTKLHPDTGANPEYGIPFVVAPADQPLAPVRYTDYGDESDPGPFPIPPTSPIEGGPGATGDRHVIVVHQGSCQLVELFGATKTATGWDASSGAAFNLRTNDLRPKGWTSADAAGLPIFPGLMRFDEVRIGEIRHALRFTASRTQRGFISPARHFAGRDDPNLPPMGARFRLKANADISRFTGDARVILQALKIYGMLLADNGSSWFISGATDPRWDDEDLGQLKTVPGDWFEVVDTGPIER